MKGRNWTTVEDYYLLEGLKLHGKKWNLVVHHMEASGHLDNTRDESMISSRFKNLSKEDNPYKGLYQRKKLPKQGL
jgi:hypothetical protein